MDVKVLEGGGLTVELIRDPSAQPRVVPRPEMVHGFSSPGFTVKDLDKTVDQLRERGVEIAFGPFPARAIRRRT